MLLARMQLPLPFLRVSDDEEIHGLRAPLAGSEPFLTGPRPDNPIEFVRVNRARRYILRVCPDGTLRVTVPRGGSRREAQQFVEKQRRWIERERQRVRNESGPRMWRDGSEILLRGCLVRISVTPAPRGSVVSYGDRRLRIDADADVRAAIESDLRDLARVELVSRVRELAAEHGLRPGAVSIRNQRSRWGSCARSGRLALNFRLVQMPPAIRDYVILHELMHLRQQNHSSRFWRLVESACPDYRDAERWLRLEGRALF
jgi:predicted metal-dependent hydrolase